MRKFDTKVQHLKYKVLRSVARYAWEGTLERHLLDIPQELIPGTTPTMRCCVYKERAILAERVKLALGGYPENPNVIQVLPIACDECPRGGYTVTMACRGCLAHRCEDVCPVGAITFDEHQKAHIDKVKCINCGRCARVCAYTAIVNQKRPCERACKVGAIGTAEDGSARIDNERCIACGACVYQCPWGAIEDKSYILEVIRLLQAAERGEGRVYAIVAPTISSQFIYANLTQVISGIRVLGFDRVMEAALGADLVSYSESAELAEKGRLFSSCCPAFVSYVRGQFPALAEHISHNLSPAATIGRYIKERDPEAGTVFIGPCTAKKMEAKQPRVAPWLDAVITFEELQALFDSRDIDIAALPAEELVDASYYGRSFARSCGLSGAVEEALREQGLNATFALEPVVCDGIEQCRTALLKADKGRLEGNFLEGMACEGGCIGGAGCLTHGAHSRLDVEKYSGTARHKTIGEAIQKLEESAGALTP